MGARSTTRGPGLGLRRPRRAPVLLLHADDRAGAGRCLPARVTVSVIIVNWNAGPALDACLASLATGGVAALEVVLVDSASIRCSGAGVRGCGGS